MQGHQAFSMLSSRERVERTVEALGLALVRVAGVE